MRPFLRLVEAVRGDSAHRKKNPWSWFPRSIEPTAGDDPPNPLLGLKPVRQNLQKVGHDPSLAITYKGHVKIADGLSAIAGRVLG